MKQYSIVHNWSRRAVMASACALCLTASLGWSALPAATQDPVKMTVDASAVPAFVAADKGFFGDLPVEVSQVGYDQVNALLLTGETEIGWLSPIETAQFVAEGSDLRYFSTAGAQNMYNGVIIRAADTGTFASITDLKGKRLGIPGYGTGIYTIFVSFLKAFYDIDDPQTYFNMVTASSGALLALVEQGEVDGALLFTGSSAAARSLPQFHTLFSFTESMQQNAGQPLVITGAVATAAWLDKNPEAAAKIVAGLDKATLWIKDNPQAFAADGEYARLAEEVGWLTQAETTSTVQDLLAQGKWFLTSETYTPEWVAAVHDLIAKGGSLATVPAAGAIFLAPGTLPKVD